MAGGPGKLSSELARLPRSGRRAAGQGGKKKKQNSLSMDGEVPKR